MRRFLNFVLAGCAMFAIAGIFAFVTMRLAIHGTQVEVPNLTGLTVSEAQERLGSHGLNLLVVSRFYSATVPAGHLLSQVPAPGVIVRQEWEVRAIESLGPQRVSIPDVRAMPERPATITIRRLSLDLGTVAHLPSAGDPGIVLAQTPPPNAGGVDSPRVSLLVSEKADTTAAFVMPQLIGLSAGTAYARAVALGLNVSDTGAVATDPSTPDETLSARTVTNQVPQAGYRVNKGETVRLTLGGS